MDEKGGAWGSVNGQKQKFIAGNMMPVPITGEAQRMPAFDLAAVPQGPLYLYSEPVVS